MCLISSIAAWVARNGIAAQPGRQAPRVGRDFSKAGRSIFLDAHCRCRRAASFLTTLGRPGADVARLVDLPPTPRRIFRVKCPLDGFATKSKATTDRCIIPAVSIEALGLIDLLIAEVIRAGHSLPCLLLMAYPFAIHRAGATTQRTA